MVTTAADIRRTFLEYFQDNGHTIVPSSPLVPRNDPTLMFTNSGMVQFKDVFTGKEQRPYNRATSSQKSVRAGGKHNDLENVGYTARHHTFFEMLGNFSFGAVEPRGGGGTKSYFKADAIEFAWNLITKSFALDPKRLTVTVFHEDEEAYGLWKKIAGFSDDKIIRIATADNFWRMGDLGPCGPCTEIFWDHGDKIRGGPPGSPDEDGDRFVEIWNLVFMQFEQRPGEMVPLPKPSVDTGMGLERVAAVLQGVHDNYDIDLMRALVVAAADGTSTDPDGPQKASHRVIADHLRSTSFLIADGVMPSNEGRGYVLRRILRRAARHAHLLGARDPLLHRLVPVLVREMGQAFPELVRAEKSIIETLRLEETRFKAALERGLKLLDEATASLPADGQLPGETAFRLYDTFGFPLDLTQDVLRGQGRSVDEAGFDTAMARQKAEARKAWAGTGEAATDAQWFELRDELGATEFLGYDTERAQGRVTALLVDSGSAAGPQRAHEATQGARVELLLNQTPFYAESGGQVGDAGVITTASGTRIVVQDTQKKLGQLFVHIGTVESGAIAVGDEAELQVDHARRGAIRANHSATHLLHEALRRRMGEHVAQKGSLVAPERLRFDISQPTPLTASDIAAVEIEVNQRVRGDSEVTTRLMTPDEAIAQGAMALFGEKYGDEVRVVAMGGRDDGANKEYSIELCGGTHVGRTGEIGLFKIVGESAVSAGVRRIEALTGSGALAWIAEQEKLVKEAAAALKSTPAEVPARVIALVEERRRLEREVTELRRKLASGETEGGAETKQIAGITLVARRLTDVPAKDLKPLADELKKKAGSGVVALAAATDGKLSLVVGVTDDLTGRWSAVDLVRSAAEAAGGKGGGGRPDMAQAGGPDAALADAALAAIEKALGAATA
ncbi:MAG: alanine--tRNA ligase [Rhodospirillales bacterium]|nr:alanine--tRNA ligase [Rhodospirillales bacterium]